MTEIVQIDSQVYDTYATVEEADIYLMANFLAATWQGLTQTQKAQLLVTSTRLFDRQCWLGEKTDPDQPLQWPRKNTGIDGVDENVVPDGIKYGSIEMALALADGSDAVNKPTPGVQDLQTLSAGSVSMTWFRGAEGILGEIRFPLVVQELVGQYLCGSGSSRFGGVKGYGICEESVTKKDFGYTDGI